MAVDTTGREYSIWSWTLRAVDTEGRGHNGPYGPFTCDVCEQVENIEWPQDLNDDD